MTDDDRNLDLECLFDGELPENDRHPVLERLAGDPDARRHLDQLAMLRDLARRHDPASKVPRRAIRSAVARSRGPWWLAVASMAAAVALICWPRDPSGNPPGIGLVDGSGKGTSVRTIPITVRPSPPFDRPPLEVAIYGWANAPRRAPGDAARLVLSPASPSRKRSPADEILAIELANASPNAQGNVRRFAVSRGSKVVSTPRTPALNPRPRTAQPHV